MNGGGEGALLAFAQFPSGPSGGHPSCHSLLQQKNIATEKSMEVLTLGAESLHSKIRPRKAGGPLWEM